MLNEKFEPYVTCNENYDFIENAFGSRWNYVLLKIYQEKTLLLNFIIRKY